MPLQPSNFLSPAVKAEFTRLVNVPGADFREFELRALERYCQLIVDVRRLREEVDIVGETLINPEKGTTYPNPAWCSLQAKEKMLLTLEKELGFTVRTRKDKNPPKAPTDLRDRLGVGRGR